MKGSLEAIDWAVEGFAENLVISMSLQHGGVVVLDLFLKRHSSIRAITLDTGRLPDESFQMMELIHQRFGIRVELVVPDPGELNRMTTLHGPNLFYRDRPSRLLCCQVRKVRPLGRRLQGVGAVLTGLRRGQSESRGEIQLIDESSSPVKVNPLAHWTETEVLDYIRVNDLPVHPLYQKGFQSISCSPCTRATREGEDARAGRWWWESDQDKECGIHFSPHGVARREIDVMLQEILADE